MAVSLCFESVYPYPDRSMRLDRAFVIEVRLPVLSLREHWLIMGFQILSS
jgi:hypothetical protein